MERFHQSIFVAGVRRAIGEIRVRVEVEIVDDLHGQRVGLQDADLCVDSRTVFWIFQQ